MKKKKYLIWIAYALIAGLIVVKVNANSGGGYVGKSHNDTIPANKSYPVSLTKQQWNMVDTFLLSVQLNYGKSLTVDNADLIRQMASELRAIVYYQVAAQQVKDTIQKPKK